MSSWVRRIVLVAITVVWTLPVTGLVLNAFQAPDQGATSGWWTQIVDPHLSAESLRTALAGSDATTSMLSAFLGSLVIALPSAVITVGLGAIAAYALALTSIPGRRVLLAITFGLLVVPVQVTLVPLVAAYDSTGLRGSVPGLWLAHVAFGLPLAIVLLRAAMTELPTELLEAARTDGAGPVDVLVRVVAPLIVPALVAVGSLSFLLVWNDLVVTVALLGGTDSSVTPLPLALAELVSTHPQDHPLLAAGALLTALVPLIVYAWLSRLLISATEAIHLR